MSFTVPTSLVTLALIAGIAAPAVAGAERHNGTWSVELVTESGVCSARYNYAVAIRDGEVRAASASGGGRVSGRVSPDGTVGITVAGAAGSGSGTGHLTGSQGSGTWSVSSLCTGRWTARRGDTRTAQAE